MSQGPGWLADFLELLFEPCVKHRPMCVSTPGGKGLNVRWPGEWEEGV